MSNIYGYNRVSSKKQNLDRGNKSIEDFCARQDLTLTKIYSDKISGKTFDRTRYIVLKEDILRNGDVLIIPELDRFGRNKKAILDELVDLKNKGIRVMILDIPTTLVNLSQMQDNLANLILETINNMLIEMYATFAQAENDKKDKRRTEGIQAMKDRGEWERYGRPRKMSLGEFKREYEKVESGEMRPTELIRELGLTYPTYYRYRKEIMKQQGEF